VAIPATIAKYLGTYLTKRQIADLEAAIMAESPLGRAAKARVEAEGPGPTAGAVEEAVVPGLTAGIASVLSPHAASPLAAQSP
jgi:hypothetical protein